MICRQACFKRPSGIGKTGWALEIIERGLYMISYLVTYSKGML